MRAAKIIQSVHELPDPYRIREFYADAETKSGDKKRSGDSPYSHGDRAVGWGLTHDDNPQGFYIPLRHSSTANNLFASAEQIENVDLDQFRRWWNIVARGCREWINHGVKFDAHFAAVDGFEIPKRLVDTLTLGKLVDGHRSKHEYGLKPLTGRWLGEAQDARDTVNEELLRLRSKDFGDVDPTILGPYAIDDVLRNRRLWKEINRRRYEGDGLAWGIEIGVTRALFNIERRPIYVDVDRLSGLKVESSLEIEKCEDVFHSLGYRVDVSSDKKLKDFVFGELDLPVLSYNEKNKPSVDSAAIDAYLADVSVKHDPSLVKFFETLSVYREHAQFVSLYAEGWAKCMHPGTGIIHPFYNQMVATGRMSCTRPNMQQLNKKAKSCIIPAPGLAFISRDYSQIEYRVIASLCRDPRMIEAYRNDPKTDFHDYVASLCGIERRPAKSVNFGISFSMGENGLLRQLRASLGDVSIEDAREILAEYNREFPRIKIVSKAVVNRAQVRAGRQDGEWGYIKTLYGSRRYLRYYKYRSSKEERKKFSDETRLAFNTTVQGTAAYIMKEALIKLDRSETLLAAGVRPSAVIHDDFIGCGSLDAVRDREVQREYEGLMCSPSIDLGLPLIADGNESEESWAKAA